MKYKKYIKSKKTMLTRSIILFYRNGNRISTPTLTPKLLNTQMSSDWYDTITQFPVLPQKNVQRDFLPKYK